MKKLKKLLIKLKIGLIEPFNPYYGLEHIVNEECHTLEEWKLINSKKSKLQKVYENLIYDLYYYTYKKPILFIINIILGIRNLIWFFKVIFNYRANDSYYEYEILKRIFDLRIKKLSNGIEPDYEGSEEDLKTLIEMREYLYKINDNSIDHNEKEIKKFFDLYKKKGSKIWW